MTATKWTDLLVECEGETFGTLGSVVSNAPANLDTAEVAEGRIVVWPDFLLAAPGETMDWDTPREEVDWTGFPEALAAARKQDL